MGRDKLVDMTLTILALLVSLYVIYLSVVSTKINLGGQGFLYLIFFVTGVVAFGFLDFYLNAHGILFVAGFAVAAFCGFFINCPNCGESIFEWGEKPVKPIFFDPPKTELRPNFSFIFSALPFAQSTCTGCGLPTDKLYRDAEKIDALKSEIPDYDVKRRYIG